MVAVAAFRGVRFASGLDLAACTAPPYDAIDDEMQARLYRASPHNVVRLERPWGAATTAAPAHGGGVDTYAEAARTYRSWVADGVLLRDPDPTLTVYEQVFVHDGRQRRQRGVLCALGLEPWGAGVLPHERVFRAPVEDRKRLLRSLRVNVSPVFVVHEDRDGTVGGALDEVGRGAPAAEFDDPEGVRHRTWVCADRDLQRAVAGGLRGAAVLMADGHHRYTTALEHRAESGHAPGTSHVLAYAVATAQGPVVRPMHRLVRGLPADAPGRLAAAGFDLVGVSGDADGVLQRVLDQQGLCLGLLTGDGWSLLVARDELAVRRSLVRPQVLRRVDVAVLHAVLVDVLGLSDRPGVWTATNDHGEGACAVADGSADALLLAPPPTPEQVRAVAEAGVRMPPKSTSFHPKPRTGLVLRPLDEP